jgi:hypothetical protein
MLAAAIEIAAQIPNGSPARTEASRMIDQWSYQMLQLAQVQAGTSVTEAIAIANRIPSSSAAYAEAQRQIQAWRQGR